MATGYEVGKVRSIEVAAQALRGCERQLLRIADYLERLDDQKKYELGSQEHWMHEVQHARTVNSYTSWKAWYESDQNEPSILEPYPPEITQQLYKDLFGDMDPNEVIRALKSLKGGFKDLEDSVRKEGE